MSSHNPLITITKQENYYTSYNEPFSCNWLDLIIWFKHPFICDDKNDAPMLCGADSMAGFSKEWPHCKDYYMLLLDFDDGLTINEFKLRYKHLEYFLYTSYSHLKDGKTHKFRVLLPLAKPIPRDEMAGRKLALYDVFPEADPTNFSRFRFFSIPSCPAERKHLAYTHYNQGELFDLHPLKFIPLPKPLSKEELAAKFDKAKDQTIDPIKQAMAKNKIVEKFSKLINTEHGYNDMRSMAIQLACIGLDVSEAVDLIASIPHPTKYSPEERAESGFNYWAESIAEVRSDVLAKSNKLNLLM